MNTQIAFNLFLGFGVVSMVLVFYHLWRMDHNIREEKLTLAFFLIDFVPFMPGVRSLQTPPFWLCGKHRLEQVEGRVDVEEVIAEIGVKS
jgi:hypothetical protein